jgi:hypothetical protein
MNEIIESVRHCILCEQKTGEIVLLEKKELTGFEVVKQCPKCGEIYEVIGVDA